MKLPEIKPIIFSNVKNDVSFPDPSTFKNPPLDSSHKNKISPESPSPLFDKNIIEHWNIEELEKFFSSASLPVVPVKLNPWTTILNISLFIDSHLAVVKNYNGIPNYKPYFNRLIELKKTLLLYLN